MSVVTGILLCHSFSEDYEELGSGSDRRNVIQQINDFLNQHDKSALHQLDEKMCNGKHPQMIVWGGGYNYFPDAEFLEFFKSLKWKNKDEVFMIFNSEHAPMEVIRPVNARKAPAKRPQSAGRGGGGIRYGSIQFQS